MEVYWCNLAIVFFFTLFLLKLFLQKHANTKKTPPTPPGLPFIGHLHMLKQPLHKTLHQISEKYGHVFSLQFGTRKVLVVSSPSAVEECFTKNDIIFANRPRSLAGKHLNYNYSTIGFASYGDLWRNLRRFTTLELFYTSRLAMFSGIRIEEVRLVVKQIFQDASDQDLKVELSSKFMDVAFNIMLRLIAGKRYYGKDIVDEEAKQFRDIMWEYQQLSASSNLVDFLPLLRWVDFQRVESRMIKLKKKIDYFMELLLKEHRTRRSKSALQLNDQSDTDKGEMKKTLIDVMLSLQEKEPEFTMDWAMALLLNHPEKLERVVAEMDAKVGFDHLLVESELEKLNNLQNVITETLRLYPPAPLLLPHESAEDCTGMKQLSPILKTLFGGKKRLETYGNVFAIHGETSKVNQYSQRDPKLWVDAERFMPERFDGGEISEGYKSIPFGAGRRICPAAAFGRRVVGLGLGALLQCFEWNRVGKEDVNMEEKSALTNPRAQPLEALCKPRQPLINHLLAFRNVLLISSPSAVEEAFSKNDVAFANRPRLLVGKYLNYNYTTVGAAPYGQHWRNLRRLTALEIFSTSRLNTFLSIRRDEVRLLVKNLHESSSHSFTRVEMKSKLSELSFNVIMRMVAGKRYFGVKADNEEAKRFRDITKEIFEIGGASPEDFIPALRWWNYKSIEKRMKIVQKKADSFMQSLIDEQRTRRNGPVDEGEKTKTMIDSMLSLQESDPNYYTDDIIKGIILTLLSAGTDTSAGTMEWAMSLLLNHPAVLKKARAELDNYVGNERLADESDLAKIPYIQSIVNETLRLYPAAPLLVPHESSEDTTIGGYYVPRQTMLMVNAWAIHRDPKVWDDPTSFKPERFEGLKGESEAYKFIPFGLGRRACPGAGLANRVMAWHWLH
ncbi:hypothetical protein JRO89_XS07G0080000 [Xanthoceras sorbifolium]|uniref:Cytochrome P450 n=1 Tax=Xanthoceras sorbifolium TaxID=99658 RepID=A0ABQ8HT05_9ROSI|nr:hypothetical protein JRO89_XS07G0080000 [Xanthoceras sorbifolium]